MEACSLLIERSKSILRKTLIILRQCHRLVCGHGRSEQTRCVRCPGIDHPMDGVVRDCPSGVRHCSPSCREQPVMLHASGGSPLVGLLGPCSCASRKRLRYSLCHPLEIEPGARMRPSSGVVFPRRPVVGAEGGTHGVCRGLSYGHNGGSLKPVFSTVLTILIQDRPISAGSSPWTEPPGPRGERLSSRSICSAPASCKGSVTRDVISDVCRAACESFPSMVESHLLRASTAWQVRVKAIYLCIVLRMTEHEPILTLETKRYVSRAASKKTNEQGHAPSDAKYEDAGRSQSAADSNLPAESPSRFSNSRRCTPQEVDNPRHAASATLELRGKAKAGTALLARGADV